MDQRLEPCGLLDSGKDNTPRQPPGDGGARIETPAICRLEQAAGRLVLKLQRKNRGREDALNNLAQSLDRADLDLDPFLSG